MVCGFYKSACRRVFLIFCLLIFWPFMTQNFYKMLLVKVILNIEFFKFQFLADFERKSVNKITFHDYVVPRLRAQFVKDGQCLRRSRTKD